MLIDKELSRTNYVAGMRISPSDFKRSDNFNINKFKILALGGLGYGVLQGFKESLVPSIQGNLLVIKSGAAIDKDGNLIYIPTTSFPIREDLNIINFLNKATIYIYIKYDTKLDNLKDDKTGQQQIHHEIISTYKIEVTNNKYEKSEWLELGRISIDYDKIALYNQNYIIEPLNPFIPRENEIDIRHTLKIKTNLINLEEKDIEKLINILSNLSNYLNKISFKYHLISSSIASSYLSAIKESIYSNITTPYDLYMKLKCFSNMVMNIIEENSKIKNEEFWKNIERVKIFFNRDIENEHKGKINFFSINLEDKESYFFKIVEHLDRASKCSADLNLEEEKEPEVKKKKEYVQIGRSAKEIDRNDISFPEDKSISRIHLILSLYRDGFFIEDKSTNGTFVNSERIEKGVKQFVKQSDEIILGTKNTKLNLNTQKIQELLTP